MTTFLIGNESGLLIVQGRKFGFWSDDWLLCSKHDRGIKLQPFLTADREAGYGKHGCPFCEGGPLEGKFHQYRSRKAVEAAMQIFSPPTSKPSEEELEERYKAEVLAVLEFANQKVIREYKETTQRPHWPSFSHMRKEWDITIRNKTNGREYHLERYDTGAQVGITGKEKYLDLNQRYDRDKYQRCKPMTMYDVISALCMDAATVEYGQSLDDIASEFEMLPTKAMDVFTACHRTRIALINLLGSALYQKALKIGW